MTTQTLTSAAKLCAELQRPYATIRLAIAELGIVPAVVQDGRPFYDTAAVEQIAEHLRNQ